MTKKKKNSNALIATKTFDKSSVVGDVVILFYPILKKKKMSTNVYTHRYQCTLLLLFYFLRVLYNILHWIYVRDMGQSKNGGVGGR